MQSSQRKLEDILADVAAGALTAEQAAAEIRTRLAALQRPTSSRNRRVITFVTLTLIGCIFFSVGASFGIYSLIKGENAGRTEGEVAALIRGGKGSSRPVVRYAVDGKPFEITGWMSTSPPAYSVGEKVTVLYNPENPADGRIDSFVERWLFPVVFGGVGALLLVIGVVIWLATRPRKPALSDAEEVSPPS